MTDQEYTQFKEFIHKLLFEVMSIQDYEIIMNRMNIPKPNKSNSNCWMYKSFCHNINVHNCKNNLAFYPETRTYWCFSECNVQFNIVTLLEKRFTLIGESKTRFQCVKWLCEQLNIPFDFKEEIKKPKTDIYNWKETLGKYTKGYKSKVELTVYDKSILNYFEKAYYFDWLEYGISEETLDKYNIRWYSYRNQIVIPIYKHNGDLVGIRVRNTDLNIDMKYIPLELLDSTSYAFPIHKVFYGENYNSEQIKKTKTVWLCEGEKSVLKSDTWFKQNNITLAMMGCNLGKERLKYLLSLGVENIVIMIDSDFHKIGDEGYNKFEKNVMKIYEICKPYMKKIEVCYNNQGYDGYKYSPFDFTREEFDILYKNRERIE